MSMPDLKERHTKEVKEARREERRLLIAEIVSIVFVVLTIIARQLWFM